MSILTCIFHIVIALSAAIGLFSVLLYYLLPKATKELLLILIDNLNFKIWKRQIEERFK